MASLKDNVKRWREAAEIDWFSQFIRAWIPFNAWLTDTYGHLSDSKLLDQIKGGNNVVFNRIVPTLDGVRDSSHDASEFRLEVDKLHRLLQACIINGRKGRLLFENVDIGFNKYKDESLTVYGRNFRVRRDHPQPPEVTSEISATKTSAAFLLTMPEHDRRALEDDLTFQKLDAGHRSRLLAMHKAVAPRLIRTVLAEHTETTVLTWEPQDLSQNRTRYSQL